MKQKFILIFFLIFYFSTPAFSEFKEVDYRIIYIIHGDANYFYHDNGREISADKRILNQAIDIAENAKKGEVFIFYQKKKENFLFVLPEDDGEFYYYKNGKKLIENTYSRGKSFGINTEAELFGNNLNTDNSIKSILLYYGHEIPEREKKGYNVSYFNKIFTVDDFAVGLNKFVQLQKKMFDLVLLSTCNNGTPYVVEKLSPLTDKIIASPENLHLSFIDSEYLKYLDNYTNNFEQFAENFGKKAFDKLRENVQTIITLSLYNTKTALNYIKEKRGMILENNNVSNKFSDDGVKVYFSPPKFGSNKNQTAHSGWGKSSFDFSEKHINED